MSTTSHPSRSGRADDPNGELYDPVYRHARRETLAIMLMFSAFCLWSVLSCSLFGYLDPNEQPFVSKTTLGMPSWVFWGIFLPWIVVDIVAVWFCFVFMKDDDLGAADDEAEYSDQVQLDDTGQERKNG